MMASNFEDLLEESSKVEISVAELYNLFANIFSEDRDFWNQLCLEEKNHAQLIQNQRKFFTEDLFPDEILCKDIEELRSLNAYLDKIIQQFDQHPPSRAESFEIALKIEKSAGEKHFQEGMKNKSPSPALKFFQELNLYDLDHIERIKTYMHTHIC